MLGKLRNRGFTLTETIIVLAITALIASFALTGIGLIQRRSRFRDSVERVVAQLEALKSEVASGYITGQATVSPNRVHFGKVVTFTNGSSSYRIQSLTAPDVDDCASIAPGNCINNPITAEGIDSTVEISWQVSVDNVARKVAFIIEPSNGDLNVYSLAPGDSITATGSYNPANDGSVGNLDTVIELESGSLQATITIDSATGAITRTYNN